jgi:hypothetical protein
VKSDVFFASGVPPVTRMSPLRSRVAACSLRGVDMEAVVTSCGEGPGQAIGFVPVQTPLEHASV